MRKLTLLALVAAFGLLAMGCAISDYPIITDTEHDDAGFVVNTAGKAVLVPTSQVITLWPDRNEELFSLIDQKDDGIATLTNHVMISYPPSKWLGYQYCNVPHYECSFLTSVDDSPAMFQYTTNPNCGGYDSWSVTVAFTGRTGLQECGDATSLFGDRLGDSGLTDQDMLEFVAQGVPENDMLRYELNADTVDLTLTANGDRYPVVLQGNVTMHWDPTKGIQLDLRNTKAHAAVESFLAAADALRADHGLGAEFNVEGSIYGHDFNNLPSRMKVAFRNDFQTDWIRANYGAVAPQLDRRALDRR